MSLITLLIPLVAIWAAYVREHALMALFHYIYEIDGNYAVPSFDFTAQIIALSLDRNLSDFLAYQQGAQP